jgi:hypothetical protein
MEEKLECLQNETVKIFLFIETLWPYVLDLNNWYVPYKEVIKSLLIVPTHDIFKYTHVSYDNPDEPSIAIKD